MQPSINRVLLLGQVGRQGVEVSYHGDSGTPKAAFMLVVSELGTDGKEHQLWQPVEIWGKKAEQTGELDAGAVVMIEGKLRRQKRGENWETVVSGWDCTPLALPVSAGAAAEGRHN
jgi:single-stranded DNA-binding protein